MDDVNKFVGVFLAVHWLLLPVLMCGAWLFGLPVGHVWQGFEFAIPYGVGFAALMVIVFFGVPGASDE